MLGNGIPALRFFKRAVTIGSRYATNASDRAQPLLTAVNQVIYVPLSEFRTLQKLRAMINEPRNKSIYSVQLDLGRDEVATSRPLFACSLYSSSTWEDDDAKSPMASDIICT